MNIKIIIYLLITLTYVLCVPGACSCRDGDSKAYCDDTTPECSYCTDTTKRSCGSEHWCVYVANDFNFANAVSGKYGIFEYNGGIWEAIYD